MGLVAWSTSDTDDCAPGSSPCPVLGTVECPGDCGELGIRRGVDTLTASVLLVVLAWLLGNLWSFLNNSTLLPLYTARLTRAYLGASNPKRLRRNKPAVVTRVLPDDDMSMRWGRWLGHEAGKCDNDPFVKGAPLHLINVTINETLDGKLQLQQTGRKGIGMAVGPGGISAGVQHHVVFAKDHSVFPCDKGAYRMFHKASGSGAANYDGQCLTLGQWVGISGAAFSTGLGSRTTLAFSLLAGVPQRTTRVLVGLGRRARRQVRSGDAVRGDGMVWQEVHTRFPGA